MGTVRPLFVVSQASHGRSRCYSRGADGSARCVADGLCPKNPICATLVDLAPGGALAPRTALTVAHFEPHARHFTPGARILYRTGWDREFGRSEFFTEFPTLTLDAARWIASRRIGLLGMDTPTPSVDARECHLMLLAPNVEILLLEGLTGLELLPQHFVLSAFPLKVERGDGSPVRAVAIIEE